MALPALPFNADTRSITERVNAIIRNLYNLLTTRGDLLVVDSNGVLKRLPLGADGTILTSDGSDAAWGALETLTNSLAAPVALNNTVTLFTGPQVAQGTAGTWFVSGTVTVGNPTGAAVYDALLWDGTTGVASARMRTSVANEDSSISLSGVITSPAGNLRISVKDNTQTTGSIKANVSGASKDSTITAVRIG